MDHAKHLSEYDRDLVCVPETCSCGRETCRHYAHKRRSDARDNLFQICNHNLLLADAPEDHVFAEYAAELTMPCKILQGFIARKQGIMSRPLLRKVRNTY